MKKGQPQKPTTGYIGRVVKILGLFSVGVVVLFSNFNGPTNYDKTHLMLRH